MCRREALLFVAFVRFVVPVLPSGMCGPSIRCAEDAVSYIRGLGSLSSARWKRGSGFAKSAGMTNEDVLREFRESGALREGHFKLSSGLHSGVFLQKNLVFMHPERCERLCKA